MTTLKLSSDEKKALRLLEGMLAEVCGAARCALLGGRNRIIAGGKQAVCRLREQEPTVGVLESGHLHLHAVLGVAPQHGHAPVQGEVRHLGQVAAVARGEGVTAARDQTVCSCVVCVVCVSCVSCVCRVCVCVVCVRYVCALRVVCVCAACAAYFALTNSCRSSRPWVATRA
jgi:hypothetical protein